MKTKNNVQKSVFKTAIVLFAVLMAAFTQASEDSSNSKSKSFSFSSTEKVDDNSMIMETRMTSDKLYETASAALAPAPESVLDIEAWMLDVNNFTPKANAEVNNVAEKKIELWKVNDEKYGRRKFILTQVNDRNLKIERWMLVNNYW